LKHPPDTFFSFRHNIWSEEESDFPLTASIDGRSRLYFEREFVAFIKMRLRKLKDW